MSKKSYKILSFLLCFLLIFEQSGFAQMAGQLDISGYLVGLRNALTQDKFRPLHLRYLAYDTLNNNFKLLLDKGDLKDIKTPQVQDTTQKLLEYFFVGVSLPNDSFWVNLRPDSPDNIIDPYLAQTDVGKILLEADLQLKKDTAKFTSPENPKGKEYWDKLYQKAGELFGYDNITIPTLTRPWIVPDEIIVREANDNAYIYKATLKVQLEQDHLQGSAVYNFDNPRLKELNEYSSQLIRELIIPELTKEVNISKRYAPLRQVYYSLILSQWFKQKFSSRGGFYSSLIDRRNLNGITSKEDWSKTVYFKEYQKSFQKGEYNIQQPIYTPFGQTIRSYFSGGIDFGVSQGQGGVLAAAMQKGLVQAATPGDVLAGNSHALPVDVNKGGTPDNVGVDRGAIQVGKIEETSSPIISPVPKGTLATLLRYMYASRIFSDNPKKSSEMALQRGGNDSLRTIQRELQVLRAVGLVEGDGRTGYYLSEWLKSTDPEEIIKEGEALSIPNPSNEQLEKTGKIISLWRNKSERWRKTEHALFWIDTQAIKSSCRKLADKINKINPHLSELTERLFQNHRYGSYGSHFSIESPPLIDEESFISSIGDLEQRIGKTNVYWPLFSDSDKRDILDRLRTLRENKAANYIESVVKTYVRQSYGVECEVVAIYVNGSYVYRWSSVIPPADVDNVVLIRVSNPNLTIREVIYEIPEELRNPQMNISGMAVQSVNDLNSDHPHTQTALGSIYLGGIPILEKERLICEMDKKNLLFHAFKLLEDGRIRLSSDDPRKQAKWFGRVVELKGILYKLGFLEKFDHHVEWNRFDEFNRAILSNDTNTIESLITEALREYVELRTIIESALALEKEELLKRILEEYSNCNTEIDRQSLINRYVMQLEKANGSGYGFPLDENAFRAWVDRIKLAVDKQALEREHLALLTINDLTINLSLGRNSPFSSVSQALKDRARLSTAILGQQEQNGNLGYLFDRFIEEKDLSRAYNYLTQIIPYKDKGLSKLIDLIYGGDAFSKQLALYALGEIGSPRAVPFILDICSSILKLKINPSSTQESVLNFAIEALGKCNSEKAAPFLLNIFEQGGTDHSNATISNSYRAMASLLELCKNPAIKFLIVWRIKEVIQMLLERYSEENPPEDTYFDYKAARIIDLLVELPIEPSIKKDLSWPLINLYTSKKDFKKNPIIYRALVQLGNDLSLFTFEDLRGIYAESGLDVDVKAKVVEAMGELNNREAIKWLKDLDFSNEIDLKIRAILSAAKTRTLSLINSSPADGLIIWEAGFHGLYDLALSALGHRDSGGQIVYQVELTKELGKIVGPNERAILVTRGIIYDEYLNKAYPGNSFGLFEEQINDGSSIVRLPFGVNSFLARSEFWNYQKSFKRYLQRLSQAKGMPSLIHIHSGDACTLELAKWAVENGIPIVFTVHSAGLFKLQTFSINSDKPRQEFAHMQSPEELLRRIIAEDAILKLSNKVILSTKDEFNRQLENYSSFANLEKEEKVAIIAPGVGVISTEPSIRSRLGQRIAKQLREDQKVLPCFGILSKFEDRKNIFGLIKVWHDSGLYKKSNLLIGGGPKIDSEDFSELEQTELYKKVNLFITEHPYLKGKIAFLGNLSYQGGETLEFYNILRDGISDTIGSRGVFVQPSTYEPFGLAVIESMASRIVTVATLNGGPKEIITHGVDGYLIDPQDESSFATTLDEALQEAKTGKKGVAKKGEDTFNQKYKWQIQAVEFLKLYRSIVEEYRDSGPKKLTAVLGENVDSLAKHRFGLTVFKNPFQKIVALFSKNGVLLISNSQAQMSYGSMLEVLKETLMSQLASYTNESCKINIAVSNSDLVVQQKAWSLATMELDETNKEAIVYINKVFLEALKLKDLPEQHILLSLLGQFLVEQCFFLKNDNSKVYEDFSNSRKDKYKELLDFVKERVFGISNGFMKKMPMYTVKGRLKPFEDWFERVHNEGGKFLDLGLGMLLDEETNIPIPPTTFELARRFPQMTIYGADVIIPAVAISIKGKWAFFNDDGKLVAMMEQASEGRLRRVVFKSSDLEEFSALYERIKSFDDRAPKMFELSEEKAIVIFRPYELYAKRQGISNIRFICSDFNGLKNILGEKFDYGRIFNVLAHYDQEAGSQIIDNVIPLFKRGAILFEGQSIGDEGLVFSEYMLGENKWMASKIWLSKNCSGILSHVAQAEEAYYIDVDLLPVLLRQNSKLTAGLRESYIRLRDTDPNSSRYGNTLVNSLEEQGFVVQKEHMGIDIIGIQLNGSTSMPPEGSVRVSSSPIRENAETSILKDQRDKKGGVDFRALPIITQPLNTPKINMPLNRLDNFQADPEWIEIQNMVDAGIIPSGQRIKDYLQSCCQKKENGEISAVLNCIADILRIEEERVSATDPEFKDMLILLESGKSTDELKTALNKINFQAEEPKLTVNP